jgi:hypothetical protein
MKNSELLTFKGQDLPSIEKQRQYVLRSLVQKNTCPNCGYALNFFEGASVDIDEWEDKPGPTPCKCTACERELVYVVPFVATGSNGGWHWHLVPVERE